MTEPTVISLFTGGMGLDLGFEDQGFAVRVALDNDAAVEATIRANGRHFPVVTGDVSDTTTADLLKSAGLTVGGATVVTGAPPCEPFSTAGARNGFSDQRAGAVHSFLRIVREAQPQYFVFEEVPGFLRAAKQHISFYRRSRMRDDEVHPDFRLGSAFDEVMEEFQDIGYRLSFDPDNPKASLLNSADYGVPQKRIRFILLGAREGPAIELPTPTHGAPDSKEVQEGARKPWSTLRDALKGLDSAVGDEWVNFPEKWGQYLHMVNPGGCWRDLPEHLHAAVLGGAYDDGSNPETAGLKGGRTGFLRKLSWDRPSPTLVDRPTNKANCLCHPDHNRPLSIKEYARIQGFGDDWTFSGSLSQRYRLIGQATPVRLAAAIAARILEHRMANLSSNGSTRTTEDGHVSSEWGFQNGSSFANRVLHWGAQNFSDFPWRRSRSAYEILIAELLLKRTTATAAARVYEDFLVMFPSLRDVASAPDEELVSALSRVGLQHQRARAMKHLAGWLLSKHDGNIPGDLKGLLEVPGLGDYGATAILSFGHGVPASVLDTNVERILLRAFESTLPPRPSRTMLRELAQSLLPRDRHQDYNYGLLDLGRLICKYSDPKCAECPLASVCDFYSKSAGEVHRVARESVTALPSKLAAIRRDRGLSLKRLAEIAKVSKLTVIRIESGRTSPRRETLEKLGKALQVCPDELSS